MASGGPIKRKQLASSVSPEANRSKKVISVLCVMLILMIMKNVAFTVSGEIYGDSKCSKLQYKSAKR